MFYLFGAHQRITIGRRTATHIIGSIEFFNGVEITFNLCIDKDKQVKRQLHLAYNYIGDGVYDGESKINFADFGELHVESYKKILAGDGFRISNIIPATNLIKIINEV